MGFLKSFWSDERGILPLLGLLGLMAGVVGGGAYGKRLMDESFRRREQEHQGGIFSDAFGAATGQGGVDVRVAGDPGLAGQQGGQGQVGPGGQGGAFQPGAGAPGAFGGAGASGINFGLLAQGMGQGGRVEDAMGLLTNIQKDEQAAARDESLFGYSTQLAQQGFGFEQQLVAQRGAVQSALNREQAGLSIGVARAKMADELANAGQDPFQFGVKFTRKEAADVIGQQMALSNAHSNLGRLVELTGEMGLGGTISPAVRGEVGALIDTSILPALAQLTNSGVLQEAEAERLRAAIGDPTQLTSIDSGTLARLRTVQNQITDKMQSNRMAYTDIFGPMDQGGELGTRSGTIPQQRALAAQGLQAVDGASGQPQYSTGGGF